MLRAQYIMSTVAGRDALEVIKAVRELQWSTAFFTLRSSEPSAEWRAKGALRILESIDVFESSPVPRGEALQTGTVSAKSRGAAPDSAELRADVAACHRRQAELEARKERLGSLCLDVCEKSTRWLSDGRVQDPPGLGFFDSDGRRTGYYRDGTVYVARGLSADEAIRTCAHEISHHLQKMLSPWSPDSEEIARIDEEAVFRRYAESFERVRA
jgi:hypothetical protein